MGFITVTNIEFHDETGEIQKNIKLGVKFDCLRHLKHEVEWKIIYVSNPNNCKYDQVLDCIVMDEVEYGPNQFEWEVERPRYSEMPNPYDVFDSTVIMVIASIKEKEFFRCCYLVTHEYDNEELKENPPDEIDWSRLVRKIKTNNPVITTNEIAWEILNEHEIEDNRLIADKKFKDFDVLAKNN